MSGLASFLGGAAGGATQALLLNKLLGEKGGGQSPAPDAPGKSNAKPAGKKPVQPVPTTASATPPATPATGAVNPVGPPTWQTLGKLRSKMGG